MRRWGGVGGVGNASAGIGGPGGILRKGEPPRKPQLLVFGYSCKLFRDDERALYVDQGKHLIPCMGDETLKIDRYDARGALGPKELAAAERCGESSLGWDRLNLEELRAEKLCDEERYRALYRDEDEEEMYREEELKRLHMSQGARYGQVEFNYEEQDDSESTEQVQKTEPNLEDDEPFVPSDDFKLPQGMPIPETKKLNAIIEKTASFIASQGTQMEILLKAKQSGNPQFEFLSLDYPLHAYYCYLLTAIKEGRFKTKQEDAEEKPEEDDHYLHPSLAPMSVESAPSIPSISYKPSADCAYSMLVNEIKGTKDQNQGKTEEEKPPVDTGLAPPGTETYPITAEDYYSAAINQDFSNVPPEMMQMYQAHAYYSAYHSAYNYTEISKAPVIYKNSEEQFESNENYNKENYNIAINSPKPESVIKSTTNTLKLIHYSDSESDSDSSSGSNGGSSNNQLLKIPPIDQQTIIDKMASYVARNGNDFEQIVRMKGDPRFSFLDTIHEFNPYYKHKRMFYERVNSKSKCDPNQDDNIESNDESNQTSEDKKNIAPVSFSIKKMKEPEPILPKPALPYESSEEDGDNENAEGNKEEKLVIETEKIVKPEIIPEVPPPVKEIITPQTLIDSPKVENKPFNHLIYQIQPSIKEQQTAISANVSSTISTSSTRRKDSDRRNSKKKSRSPSSHRLDRLDRSDRPDRDEYKRKRRKKRYRSYDDDNPNDIITIDEEMESKNMNEYIDLTEECADDKYDSKSNNVQLERKRKVAAFLSSLKSVPAAPIGQHNTLASAMVKTLHTLQSKDDESNSKRRRRRDSSSNRKSKKRKSDRKHSENYDHENESWKHRDSYRSRRDADGYYKKSKRRRSSRDRSPDYKRSSHSKNSHKNSSKESPRSLSLELSVEEEQLRLKKLAERKLLQREEELSTTSLKELVRETRKELSITQPIKMAVDIFANDTLTVTKTACASDNDDWEKESNDGDKRSPKSDSSSHSSKSSISSSK